MGEDLGRFVSQGGRPVWPSPGAFPLARPLNHSPCPHRASTFSLPTQTLLQQKNAIVNIVNAIADATAKHDPKEKHDRKKREWKPGCNALIATHARAKTRLQRDSCAPCKRYLQTQLRTCIQRDFFLQTTRLQRNCKQTRTATPLKTRVTTRSQRDRKRGRLQPRAIATATAGGWLG